MTENHALQFREFVSELKAELLSQIENRHSPFVVGLDGPDCSGKSTLTQALVGEMMSACRILPIHFDDFFNPPTILEQSIKDLPERFRQDYFNWPALQDLLNVLSGNTKSECQIDVILIEGLFLFEPERVEKFDYRVRLEISAETVVARALRRDVGVLGDADWVEQHYRNECLPAQEAYIASAQPGRSAHCHIRILEGANGVRFSREPS